MGIEAQLTVDDDRVSGGGITVSGGDWIFGFHEGAPGICLSSGHEEVHLSAVDTSGQAHDSVLSYEVVDSSATAADIRCTFGNQERSATALIHLSESGVFCVTPEKDLAGLRLMCLIAIGVLPGQRLEDVLYRPEDVCGEGGAWLPSENWFVGLLSGHGGIVACAWPEGAQTARLICGREEGQHVFSAFEVEMDGKAVYAGLLAAPGIWRRETLQLDYLERDAALSWRRPFHATYKTQLLLKGESTTPRTFTFASRRDEEWRPEIGSYVWPVWFEGDQACLSLSKRIPPKGEAVFYPMADGDKTLMNFLNHTPVGALIAQRNTPRDPAHGPREAPNVGFNACWGTFLMRRSIYASGLQEREKEFLREHNRFLADHVAIVQQQNAAYFAFIAGMREQLNTWLDAEKRPKLRTYFEAMLRHVDLVEEGHCEKMTLYGESTPEAHVAHAGRNVERLDALLETPGTEVYPECFKLIDEFNRMAWGHNESTGMRFSMLVRAWAQDAAKGCAHLPDAAHYARIIRDAIRDALNGAPSW